MAWDKSNDGQFKYEERPDPLLRKIRDARGRIQRVRPRAKKVHQAMALKGALMAVDELNRRVREHGRPQRDSHLLAEALLTEGRRGKGNYSADFVSFRFGDPDWLDRSPAKLYWRRLEMGGQQKYLKVPFFFTNGVGMIQPFEGGNDLHLKQVRDEKWEGRTYMPRPIAAYEYMRVAQRQFMAGNFVIAAYNDAFADIPGFKVLPT